MALLAPDGMPLPSLALPALLCSLVKLGRAQLKVGPQGTLYLLV